MTSKKRFSNPTSLTTYCNFNVTPLNMIQSADLAFFLIVFNRTTSQMIFYTVGASLAELNVTNVTSKETVHICKPMPHKTTQFLSSWSTVKCFLWRKATAKAVAGFYLGYRHAWGCSPMLTPCLSAAMPAVLSPLESIAKLYFTTTRPWLNELTRPNTVTKGCIILHISPPLILNSHY